MQRPPSNPAYLREAPRSERSQSEVGHSEEEEEAAPPEDDDMEDENVAPPDGEGEMSGEGDGSGTEDGMEGSQ